MLGTTDVDRIIGAEMVDSNNDKVGKVSQVYLDSDTNNPTWVSVKTGLFGHSETLVPVDDASLTGEALRVNVHKDQIKEAPRVEPDQEISPEEQDRLYTYYHRGNTGGYGDTTTGGFTDGTQGGTQGVTYSDTQDRADYSGSTTGRTGIGSDRGTVGHDTSGPNTDDAMTRSEERLNVGVQRVQTGRATLRKYIVTERQTVTVPVSHEEVRLEREPITNANMGAATSGPNLSEEEHEVTLAEERVVVNKETVPVERVRLDKEQVTENQTITEDVRKEQIELDEDAVTGTNTGTTTGTGTEHDGEHERRGLGGLFGHKKDDDRV